jgi:hypothetical protein
VRLMVCHSFWEQGAVASGGGLTEASAVQAGDLTELGWAMHSDALREALALPPGPVLSASNSPMALGQRDGPIGARTKNEDKEPLVDASMAGGSTQASGVDLHIVGTASAAAVPARGSHLAQMTHADDQAASVPTSVHAAAVDLQVEDAVDATRGTGTAIAKKPHVATAAAASSVTLKVACNGCAGDSPVPGRPMTVPEPRPSILSQKSAWLHEHVKQLSPQYVASSEVVHRNKSLEGRRVAFVFLEDLKMGRHVLRAGLHVGRRAFPAHAVCHSFPSHAVCRVLKKHAKLLPLLCQLMWTPISFMLLLCRVRVCLGGGHQSDVCEADCQLDHLFHFVRVSCDDSERLTPTVRRWIDVKLDLHETCRVTALDALPHMDSTKLLVHFRPSLAWLRALS